MPRGPGSLVVSVQSPGSDGRPPGTSPSATCWRQVEGQSQRAASETGATSLHTRAHSDRLWGAVQVPVTVRDDLASEKGQVGRDGTSSYPSLCTPPPNTGPRLGTGQPRRHTGDAPGGTGWTGQESTRPGAGGTGPVGGWGGGWVGTTLGADVGGVIPGPSPHPSAKFSSGSVSRPDFCSQILKSDAKPGFPKTIKTNDPDVLRAARRSAESFNNCSNDAFLFRESRVSRALVQVRSGLAQGSQV